MGDEEEIVFKDNPDWKDVVPLKQDDGPAPPVNIDYSEEFVEVMDYFRAIVKANEKSERALHLTRVVISINAANYTAWYYRRLILEALGADLRKELEMTDGIAAVSPKNYQLWYHRRWLVEKLADPAAEFDFTNSVFAGDSKNYHAWSHRQWVMGFFGLHKDGERMKKETDNIERLISTDLRNNSAWNYRFYLVQQQYAPDRVPDDVALGEVEFAWTYICRSPNNQSPWLFVKGYLDQHQEALHSTLQEKCEVFIQKHKFCSHPLALLVDIHEKRGTHEDIVLANEYCDKILSLPAMYQKNYWEFRKASISKKLEQ